MKYLFGIAWLLALAACKEESHGPVLATAYGTHLYYEDMAPIFHDGISEEDSVFLAKEFIDQWIAQQVILNKSKTVLTEQERDKSKQINKYLNDLLYYETLNKLAEQRVDSQFSEGELLSYYNENLKEFELSQNIVKLMFIKLPKDLDEDNVIWNDFRRSQPDLPKLKELATESGGNYFMDTTYWVYFDDVLQEIPIHSYNQEHFLNNNTNIKINEGGYRYYVKIVDFRIKSGQSPFEMEKERIKKILFVKLQEQKLQELEKELIEEAYNNNKISIH